MNFDISFTTPVYIFLFGLIASVLISYFLYLYKSKDEITKSKRYLLFGLRTLSFMLIFFLLAKPVIEIVKTHTHPAVIAIGVDNSRSVAMLNHDKLLTTNIKRFISTLKNDFSKQKIETFTFGKKVKISDSFDFSESQTDLSSAIQFGQENFAKPNLKAIILLSDGIFNFGKNPVYQSEKVNVPVFTISSTDLKSEIDLKFAQLVYNEIAYKGTKSSIRIRIKTKGITEHSFNLRVKKGKAIIFNKNIQIPNKKGVIEVEVPVKFEKNGMIKFQFSLSDMANEINYDNNQATIVIKVLDKKQEILILSSAPHPDIAALKHALEANSNLDIKTSLLLRLKKRPDADLIIFHELPDGNNKLWDKFIRTIDIEKIPAIYILGEKSNYERFNALHKGLQLSFKRKQFDPSSVVFNPTQSSFHFDNGFLNLLKNVPPIKTPYAKYKLSGDAQIIFYRQYKNILTDDPVVVYSPTNKSIIFMATGIWNWRMNDYKTNRATTYFDEFVNELVMKLLQTGNKRNELDYKPVLYEQETAHFVYFHNDITIKLAELPKLKVKGKSRVYRFRAINASKYILDLPGLLHGDYPFIFEARFNNGAKYRENGELSVIENRLESRDLTPNQAVLQKIALRSKGSFVEWKNRHSIIDSISSKVNLQSKISTSTSVDDFIFNKWFFFLIFSVLVIEWGIRKFLSLD